MPWHRCTQTILAVVSSLMVMPVRLLFSISGLSRRSVRSTPKTDADSIIYDAVSKQIFVFNGRPKSSTVIDPVKGTVIATIPLGGAPEQAVADGKGMIYDNLEDKNEVV